MFGLGFVAGPALGGLLGGYGLRLPFLLSAVLAGLNCSMPRSSCRRGCRRARRRPIRWREANPVGSLRVLSVDRDYRLLAHRVVLHLVRARRAAERFVLANELRLGWTSEQNGLALAVVGVGSALVRACWSAGSCPRWASGGRR